MRNPWNLVKNRSIRCPAAPKLQELAPRCAKAPPKGGQGVPKWPQGGPKGAPDGAKRGPREAKWGPWGRKQVKKGPKIGAKEGKIVKIWISRKQWKTLVFLRFFMVFEGSEASEFMEICKIYQKSVWNLNSYKKSKEFPKKSEKLGKKCGPRGTKGRPRGL